MKFTLFGIDWDFKFLPQMLWLMWGCFNMVGPFMLGGEPWWFVALWAVSTILFCATADSISKRISL